jgi:hypothetical protein
MVYFLQIFYSIEPMVLVEKAIKTVLKRELIPS